MLLPCFPPSFSTPVCICYILSGPDAISVHRALIFVLRAAMQHTHADDTGANVYPQAGKGCAQSYPAHATMLHAHVLHPGVAIRHAPCESRRPKPNMCVPQRASPSPTMNHHLVTRAGVRRLRGGREEEGEACCLRRLWRRRWSSRDDVCSSG